MPRHASQRPTRLLHHRRRLRVPAPTARFLKVFSLTTSLFNNYNNSSSNNNTFTFTIHTTTTTILMNSSSSLLHLLR